MRSRIALITALAVGLAVFLIFLWQRRGPEQPAPASASLPQTPLKPSETLQNSSGATRLSAHNLLLRKGPDFRVYVRWLQGEMARLKRNVNPSFDDPDSFVLNIKTGVLRANIGDIANFLNKGLTNAPLKNVKLSGDGEIIKLNGTLHKVVPIPIELTGRLSALPNDRIRVEVTKLNALKVPLKGLLGLFRVTVSDLFGNRQIQGVEVNGNNIFFDTQTLLPPPHIKGHLTRVRVANPDLEEVFGDAQEQVERVEEWRNFLRLKGGTLDFGKLTMKNVDLIMIDISKDLWFDLDLTNYRTQLTNSVSRMAPDDSLQIFMPDRRDVPATPPSTSIDWFKNRSIPPPPEVMRNQR